MVNVGPIMAFMHFGLFAMILVWAYTRLAVKRCHAISVRTSPRADAVRRAASANGHAVRQAPFDDLQRPNECQRGGAACHTPSDVSGRAGDADQ